LYLVITIDTEEDNWGEYDRASYSVENISRLPRLQDVFDRRGIRPTYLISHPVATAAVAIDFLGRLQQDGRCEVGTHPHPWNTPPLEEHRTPHNSFISHLPATLQLRKIQTLHDTITRNFGRAPTAYRSGRWGFSDDVARNLIRLGYKVDTSISPVFDWSMYGGPDYSAESVDPFLFCLEASPEDPGGSLLEVPATIGFLQARGSRTARAFWRTYRLPLGGKALGVLSRLGVLNHVCFSPETNTAAEMISLARALAHRGTTVANMFFHSPSLLEGCSPFVRTPGDATAFIERIDEVLAFAVSAGFRPVTMSELDANAAGAFTSRTLSRRPAA
jgi:peptidoglycan/xylan/chitin deacetylase (PgdA/CDA1 family)